MVHITLFAMLNLLHIYMSTFRIMCAVPNMAVFCSYLISCFPGTLLGYFLNYLLIYFINIITFYEAYSSECIKFTTCMFSGILTLRCSSRAVLWKNGNDICEIIGRDENCQYFHEFSTRISPVLILTGLFDWLTTWIFI